MSCFILGTGHNGKIEHGPANGLEKQMMPIEPIKRPSLGSSPKNSQFVKTLFAIQTSKNVIAVGVLT
jgi:hypothetical protein